MKKKFFMYISCNDDVIRKLCCICKWKYRYQLLWIWVADGVDNSFAYAETNPFLNQEDGIIVTDAYYNDLATEE